MGGHEEIDDNKSAIHVTPSKPIKCDDELNM